MLILYAILNIKNVFTWRDTDTRQDKWRRLDALLFVFISYDNQNGSILNLLINDYSNA